VESDLPKSRYVHTTGSSDQTAEPVVLVLHVGSRMNDGINLKDVTSLMLQLPKICLRHDLEWKGSFLFKTWWLIDTTESQTKEAKTSLVVETQWEIG
jgi:hypothetical protein